MWILYQLNTVLLVVILAVDVSSSIALGSSFNATNSHTIQTDEHVNFRPIPQSLNKRVWTEKAECLTIFYIIKAFSDLFILIFQAMFLDTQSQRMIIFALAPFNIQMSYVQFKQFKKSQ